MPSPLHPSRDEMAKLKFEKEQREYLESMIKTFRSVHSILMSIDKTPEREETLRQLELNIKDIENQLLQLNMKE